MPVRPPPWNDTNQSRRLAADYLTNLRNNRPARPSGSRPIPIKSATTGTPVRPNVAPLQPDSHPVLPADQSVTALPQLSDDITSPAPSPAHRRTQSDMPSVASRSSLGRPLARDLSQSSYSIRGRKVSPTATVQPPSEYRESGQRWIERQEAISIREALQEMDLQDEERKLHDAAKSEAADLVWKHRNPQAAEVEETAPYANPDLSSQRYRQHLEKGAHARSQSQSYGELAKRLPRSDTSRSVSSNSSGSNEGRPGMDSIGTSNSRVDLPHQANVSTEYQARNTDSFAQDSNAVRPTTRRKSSNNRAVSNSSSKGIFRNPEDEIFEEPEDVAQGGSPHVRFEITGPLQSKTRNSLPWSSRTLPDQNNYADKKINRVDIHKNPPTQSRNAGYTRNESLPNVPDVQVNGDPTTTKDGKEIRSDDIRAATSMKMKDRSPKLPTPTAVSDRPGRPIVSFDRSWKQSTSQSSSRQSSTTVAAPKIQMQDENQVPQVPTISLPEDSSASGIPTISLPGEIDEPAVPAISISSSIMDKPKPNVRPLPDPANVRKENKKSRVPWLNRGESSASRAGVPTATCASCALPIAGRVVTASGSTSNPSQKARFHPECFTCYHCSTSLESVEFYPEPDAKRADRLKQEGLNEVDEEADLRFYCHLDFHEFFSPRCRNCKTPIEGEIIVAAGGEWHVGHFFCAECGDPFDSSTPFVEHNNYAYCLSCHTRRTSSRCRGCKKPVLDDVTITALGGQWHEDCFKCLECGGGFAQDEGRFFVRDIEIELTEKEKRRGLRPRLEQRAVCVGCEGRRLKA